MCCVVGESRFCRYGRYLRIIYRRSTGGSIPGFFDQYNNSILNETGSIGNNGNVSSVVLIIQFLHVD